MKRRSKAGDKTGKAGRGKAAASRRNSPKAASSRPRSGGRKTVSAQSDDALVQLTVTAEVLKIIGASQGRLEPVFQALLERAARLCGAKFGLLHLYEDGGFRHGAMHNAPRAFAESIAQRKQRDPILRPGPLTPLARVIATKQVVHIADYAAIEAYKQRDPPAVRMVELAGARTLLDVPMLKGQELIGAFSIYRQEVRPFTDRQIALVENFAAQAVIAIENARLLNELRQRTDDLTESLEQQTATSEVLKVISSSPGELKPVFDTILDNATRICEAKFGILCSYDGNLLKYVAVRNAPPAFLEFLQQRGSFPPRTGTPLDELLKTRDIVHRADVSVDGAPSDSARLAGAKSHLAVPMFKDEAIVGAIIIYRQEVRPFTEKQIELIKNFAAQAVIAIENTRLLNELRQRTDDLSESLEQQTATSEVLKVISSSPGQLEPVFQAMLENATRLCEANFGTLLLSDGSAFRQVALHNPPPEFATRLGEVIHPHPESGLGHVARTKQIAHIDDIRTRPPYLEGDKAVVAIVDLAGARTVLVTPMLKENELVGAIGIYRQEVRPFADKQIALVQNFAAQAVIAIENTRLLNELRERTDQLEAQSWEVVKLNQQLEQRVADQVGEIERMGRLRRFLPPQVADLIVASGTEKQLESHRREITALFCDLRGFTGFSESSDPEDVMALLREYHAAIGEIIIKYSGTLERYAGDGVMVVFNDPVPVQNPALQAVLMALDMREAIGALIEKWHRLGHDLGFGIGIAHGYATLGTIGFEGRFDYAAIGTVSNVASRLCDEAKPGQILISPRVLMGVEQAVTVETVGDFTLKGIRRPLTAYNVVAARGAN